MSESKIIVSADIGGTNSRFRLTEVSNIDEFLSVPLADIARYNGNQLHSNWYKNRNYNSFNEVLATFMEESKFTSKPDIACFAVAGTVIDNSVQFTNLTWGINGSKVSEDMNIPIVVLINDFVGAGYGLLTLNEETECEMLQGVYEGNKIEKNVEAPIACVGAGTGLGECFLTPNVDGVYECFPSEGGHADFCPRNKLQIELWESIKEEFPGTSRISIERIVSGSGIAYIYDYFVAKNLHEHDSNIAEQIQQNPDRKAKLISQNYDNDILCKAVLDLFFECYGAEASSAALKWLPFGGLYLTGGITARNINFMKGDNNPFMMAFRDKGRVTGLVSKIPVYAVKIEDLGERGAQSMGLKLLREHLDEGNRKKAGRNTIIRISIGLSIFSVIVVGFIIYRRGNKN